MPRPLSLQTPQPGLDDSSSEWAEQLHGSVEWDREVERLQGVLSHTEERVHRATTAAQAARDTVAAVNEETRKATLAAHAAVTGVGRGRERDGKSPGTRLRKGHFVCDLGGSFSPVHALARGWTLVRQLTHDLQGQARPLR